LDFDRNVGAENVLEKKNYSHDLQPKPAFGMKSNRMNQQLYSVGKHTYVLVPVSTGYDTSHLQNDNVNDLGP